MTIRNGDKIDHYKSKPYGMILCIEYDHSLTPLNIVNKKCRINIDVKKLVLYGEILLSISIKLRNINRSQ